MSDDTDGGLSDRQRRYAGFLFGTFLTLVPVAIALILRPEAASELTGGEIELVLIALTIGLTMGHYLGRAITTKGDADLYTALGAFVTITFALLAVTYLGLGTTMTIATAGLIFLLMASLILGYASEVITNKEWAVDMVEFFADQASPLILGFVWFLEVIAPPVMEHVLPVVGYAEVGNAINTGIKMVFAAIAIGIFVYFYMAAADDTDDFDPSGR